MENTELTTTQSASALNGLERQQQKKLGRRPKITEPITAKEVPVTPQFVSPDQSMADKFEKMRVRNMKLVRGRFKNFETPGMALEFSYGPEFKGDKTTKWKLKDGEIYSLPRGVVVHLNQNCWYPEYEHIPGQEFLQGDSPDNPFSNVRIGRKNHRFGFIPLDFEGEDIGPEATLYTAGSR